jgi:hypothetical protein
MARLVGIALTLVVALFVVSFVAAHFGIVVGLVVAMAFVGRQLRRHGA